MAVLEKLEREEGFTDIEADLARYIREHADEVCQMGIRDLAAASYTSNATIVRLCRKVGVSGFRDLRVALASELERRRNARSSVDVDTPFEADQQVQEVVSSVATLTREAVDACYAALNAYDVERVARAIRAANNVLLFAYGDSEVSAIAFANRLLKLGVHCTMANLYGETSAAAHSAKPGDVVIIVSYRGGILRKMAHFLALFKERRCKTVLITAAEKPFGIDLALRFPPRESKAGKVATFYSQTCINFILNCIYSEVFELDYDENARKIARAEASERFALDEEALENR